MKLVSAQGEPLQADPRHAPRLHLRRPREARPHGGGARAAFVFASADYEGLATTSSAGAVSLRPTSARQADGAVVRSGASTPRAQPICPRPGVLTNACPCFVRARTLALEPSPTPARLRSSDEGIRRPADAACELTRHQGGQRSIPARRRRATRRRCAQPKHGVRFGTCDHPASRGVDGGRPGIGAAPAIGEGQEHRLGHRRGDRVLRAQLLPGMAHQGGAVRARASSRWGCCSCSSRSSSTRCCCG